MIGSKVIGFWGAMFPEMEGVVQGTRPGEVLIAWEDYSEWVELSQIKEFGTRTVNGSPVGIFWENDE